MKIFLILAFVCLSQVLSETENFGHTVSLSDLRDYISTLNENQNHKDCFNDGLRVPYYYAVGNFTQKVNELNQDPHVQTTAEEFKQYPPQMVNLILTQNNSSAAEAQMDSMKEKVSNMDSTLQSISDYGEVRENFQTEVKRLTDKFLECVNGN